jgi:hypothetical protein
LKQLAKRRKLGVRAAPAIFCAITVNSVDTVIEVT